MKKPLAIAAMLLLAGAATTAQAQSFSYGITAGWHQTKLKLRPDGS